MVLVIAFVLEGLEETLFSNFIIGETYGECKQAFVLVIFRVVGMESPSGITRILHLRGRQ